MRTRTTEGGGPGRGGLARKGAVMSDPVRSETSHWRDVVWRDELLARIYQPGAASPPPGPGGKRAVVVDVHGGAWSSRDRTLGERYNEAVAAAGLAVVAIDFRDGRVARHPAAVQDVAAAVQWVRDHADDLGVDPARVALTGSSSGGHLALLAALTDTEVCFVGAFWPPVDPLSRYRYAHNRLGQPVPEGQAFDAANLVAATEAYFGDEQTMGEASIVAVLAEGRPRSLPPVWLVQAGADIGKLASVFPARGHAPSDSRVFDGNRRLRKGAGSYSQ